MSEQLEVDKKMIEAYEAKEDLYKRLGFKRSLEEVEWVLDLYARLEEEVYKNEQLREDNYELNQYIEDWQVSPNKEHLSDYYKGVM